MLRLPAPRTLAPRTLAPLGAWLALAATPAPHSGHQSPLTVDYTLRVDSADLSAMHVEMRLRGTADTFRLAMAAHPEYDDRYWRYVDGPRVQARGGRAGVVVREDSALWRVVAPGGEAVVRWAVRLPAAEGPSRAAWRPFLTPTGGLVGGPHAFMYLVGATDAPASVRFDLPAEWEIATALQPTADQGGGGRVFRAADAETLVESPALVGRLRSWRFVAGGVPHRVVYWPRPDAAPFDTATFVRNLAGLAGQAIALFGGTPYREYTFLFQDGASGALEHPASVTLGAPSEQLAADPGPLLMETAHEFVHTWNLMHLRPAERGGLDWRPARPTRVLWWSEGATMFYADLLLRRAGIPTSDSTRAAHLAGLIARYLGSAGNRHIPPERSSLVAYGAPPGSLGDYSPSVHLQGELLAALLDLMVRDGSGGRRSLDDAMRTLIARHGGARGGGFTGRDVEQAVAGACGCDVRPFFDDHVRAARPIDFDRWLALAGLRARVTWAPALDREGRPAVDLRVSAWQPEDGGREAPLSLIITDSASAWGRSGLHTGDRLLSWNGAPLADWAAFRRAREAVRSGDTVRVEVARPTGVWRTSVAVTGYERPVVRLEELPDATARQRAVRDAWASAR
jgi:predicted metalloprotease with PDZ domain